MPTLLLEDGFRFFFYSSEGNEPAHIHVSKGSAEGKIWLEPTFSPVYLHGFTISEEKKIIKLAKKHENSFKNRWYEYFNQ